MLITIKNPALRQKQIIRGEIQTAGVDAATFGDAPTKTNLTGRNDPITGEWYAFDAYPLTYPFKYAIID